MRVRTPVHRRAKTASRSRQRGGAEPAAAPSGAEAQSSLIDREYELSRGDMPQDRALYECCCGLRFSAAVSADVDCPHCGAQQDW
jgi:hypothetical protein